MYRRSLQNNLNVQIKVKCPANLDLAANEFLDIVTEVFKEKKHARHDWQTTYLPKDKSAFNSAAKELQI